ncbi:CDGSH iron-sulfur domain-containing protein [Haladaptatus sp. ZSTT2]|uniref:CDGSH iron-sulfur domain-containing protein n=1 Tax=Haladaptatus sp. ZSTT2 TaxID=3120515 RepID=UPI00300F0404
MEEDVYEYDDRDITVSYDLKRCIHARECVKGLSEVFDPDRRPWIMPENAAADEIAEVITRCPTGALHFDRKDGGWKEKTPAENTVTVSTNGPIYFHGDVKVTDEAGTVLLSDTRVAFCRCGASENKPLCDNTHLNINFEAPGTVSGTSDSEASPAGELYVTLTQNGPLHVKGGFKIDGPDDGSTYTDDDAWLCRCGGSANKPFCDNTHEKIGFTTEDI